MGKVLVMCGGEQERWGTPFPRYIVPVYNHEHLLARTVRQVRKRMNNYPHIVSNYKCLRTYSTNYVVPSAHRWLCESMLSVFPVWGPDWTMILLGDVLYSEQLMDGIYSNREKYNYHFYGTAEGIYAMTFMDNALVQQALFEVMKDTIMNNSSGKLNSLYAHLQKTPIPDAGKGYMGEEDDLHFTFVLDDSRDFDSIEEYKQWARINHIKGT